MKILGFAASSSTASINKKLIAYAARLLEEGLIEDATVETIDLHDFEMPIYSLDRQHDGGIPQLAHDFFDAVGSADGLLISYAEHNGHYTAAYKNLFDWASRINLRVFQERPTVMLSTSPGSSGGGNALRAALGSAQFFGNDVRASLSIPHFSANFDEASGTVSNPEIDDQLRAALATLADPKAA